MSRIINEPVTVHVDKTSVVTAFIWRRRLYKVRAILSWWREPSQWWSGEPVRLIVRVAASNKTTGTYELCKLGANWSLHRLLD